MKFTQKIPGNVVTVEPRADPTLVPRTHVKIFHDSLLNSGTAPRRSLFALEGTGVETATVQIWILDDQGFGIEDPNPNQFAGLEWYELGAVIVVTNGETIEGPPIPEGRAYIQVTVASASSSVIKIGNAS